MPDFDKKYLAALVVAAVAIVAAFLLVARQPVSSNPEAAAQEQARQDVQKMIEEDMAAAKAQAEMNAMIRQAEMEAADNMLNAITGESNVADPLPIDDLPVAGANGQLEMPPETATADQSNVLSRDIYVRGKDKSGD